MLKFIHQMLNPHCPHCLEEKRLEFELKKEQLREAKEELKEERVCESCETLKKQLEIANFEKEKLLDRILEKPEPEIEKGPATITKPRTVPWHVRQQMLESEDRRKAELLRNAPKPSPTNEELENDILGDRKDAI